MYTKWFYFSIISLVLSLVLSACGDSTPKDTNSTNEGVDQNDTVSQKPTPYGDSTPKDTNSTNEGVDQNDTVSKKPTPESSNPLSITLKGESNITLTIRSAYQEAGAVATGNEGKDISDSIKITGELNTSKAGSYTLTYTIKNNNDSTSTAREIHVVYPWHYGALKVSDNNRSLQHANGKGFFWMADTAWDLYRKTKEDISLYVDNRAQKKFTVLQIVAMHYAKVYSNDKQAFIDGDLSKPNDVYWEHIDFLIEEAQKRGMYVALLPVWHDAIGQKSFKNPDDAKQYGAWIAKRYKEKPNLIWVIGGDTKVLDGGRVNGINMTASIASWLYPDKNITQEREMTKDEKIAYEKAIWSALGETIDKYDTKHLITFHPMQSIPSKIFNRPKWLDFNMLQSGRGSIDESIRYVEEALDEGLAVVDGESLYENLVYGGGSDIKRTPFQMREDAYSQLFVGAFGNTYGHTAVYRFWEKNPTWQGDRCQNPGICTPVMHWRNALDANGAKQMQYVTELMQSRPIVSRIPDQSLLAGEPSNKNGIVATTGDGYAMVYTSHGQEFEVSINEIADSEVRAWWYNPRNGKSRIIREYSPNNSLVSFDPPGNPTDPDEDVRNGNDWVLVIDDISKGFPLPPADEVNAD